MCFDEIAPHKGHGSYELVIYAPELGIVLDVLKDRKKASLEDWFRARGVRMSKCIARIGGINIMRLSRRTCRTRCRWSTAFM